VLYSEGNFTMNDVWGMPMYYFNEIVEAMSSKAERQKQALSKKSNTQTF